MILWQMAICLVVAGCARTPAGVVPVSGRVTLDGQPLAGAVVTFQPIQASSVPLKAGGSAGRTDGEGRFTLMLIEPPVPGALVGKHVVTIVTATSTGGDEALPFGERVPKAWRNGSRTFDVPVGGTTAVLFELESPLESPR
jgi:hypothetical protein